jgi:cell filamentation protein
LALSLRRYCFVVSRYDFGEDEESTFEPGSNRTVLRNKLHIVDSRDVDEMEASLLTVAQARSFLQIDVAATIDFSLVKELHRSWLGPLYEFAGEVRRVNMSKGGVLFAPVANLPDSIAGLDAILRANTPCEGVPLDNLVHRLAEVHVELILVHPFREGNGRIGRWIADLMALQAGLPVLSWGFDQHPEQVNRYFAAMRKGFAGDLTLLETLMRESALAGLSSDPRE